MQRSPLFIFTALLLLTLLGACNAGELSERDIQFHLPWQAPSISCTANFLENLEADLLISGSQDPCPLTIHQDLSVEGTCPGVYPGSLRYLLLTYRLPSPDGDYLLDLAHFISYVDLREVSGTTEAGVQVPFINNGINGRLVYEPVRFEEFPEEFDPHADSPIAQAKGWAKTILRQNNTHLDTDFDTCPNLKEACQGTLFMTSHLNHCNN